jgi:GNAT superfamily N-acetyltransferase
MPRDRESDVILSDGTAAHIRPVCPIDASALRLLYESLSDRSRYLRFFSSVSASTAGIIGPDVDLDDRHFAVLMESGNELLGVADFYRTHDDVAEVAFTVRDDQHGRGIGTLLLEHLAAVAAGRGVRCFSAEVLARNKEMRAVFRDAGYDMHASRAETGVVEVVFDLAPTERSREAHRRREQLASRKRHSG